MGVHLQKNPMKIYEVPLYDTKVITKVMNATRIIGPIFLFVTASFTPVCAHILTPIFDHLSD
jgi:hypothetical protein